MRTCPQQVRPAPLQGCCLPCRPSFCYAAAKSRQRQTTSCVQVIWDKTLLSHCRVIYLSRNMLQQVQPASEVRVLSLPGPTGTRPQDGYLLKAFLFKNTVCNRCSRHGLGGYCCRRQPSGLRFLIKNRQRQQFIPCICIQNDTVAWDDSANTGQMSLNGFLIECLSNRQVFYVFRDRVNQALSGNRCRPFCSQRGRHLRTVLSGAGIDRKRIMVYGNNCRINTVS